MRSVMCVLFLLLAGMASASSSNSSSTVSSLIGRDEAIRLQVATARGAISDMPIPNSSNVDGLMLFQMKRDKLVARFDKAIKLEQVPQLKELKRLHIAVEKLFAIGSNARIFPLASKASAAFARKAAMAQAYVDCAILLSATKKGGE